MCLEPGRPTAQEGHKATELCLEEGHKGAQGAGAPLL